MADDAVMEINETDTDAAVLRIYEVGYHITPSAKEEDLEKIVASIRSVIESAGGGPSSGGKASFIAEGAPSLTKLAYPIMVRVGDKSIEYDRGYFGWIKFESAIAVARSLEASLKQNQNIFRSIVFRTVREDTRAKMKAPQLREVKRTDTIHKAPRRVEESSAPISEEQLEKAIQDITAE
ncbi:MAG: 30S ribosomal protein S6 [bacterium]|nr:30S ribosomal protein S6 [bacterium]